MDPSACSHLPWSHNAAPDPPQWSLHIEFWRSLLLVGLVCCRYVSRVLYATALVATALAVGGNALILFLVGNLIAYAVRTPRIAKVLATKAGGAIAVAHGSLTMSKKKNPALS